MIYSQWIPDRGGYVYYETSERLGISDDLPIPRLQEASVLGVASTSVGRALPLGAKIVGYGPLARGSVVPLSRAGLSGLSTSGSLSVALLAALGAASAFVGTWIVRKIR